MNNCKNKKPFFLLIPFLILFGLTGIVMWLWNSILPNVLGVQAVTFWQAMGILVLSKILFGGLGGFRKHKDFSRKKQFFNKVKNMTPEEKEKFKQQWKERFNRKRFCNE